MQIVRSNGYPINVQIILYQNGLPVDSGFSASTWIFNPNNENLKANVGSDVNATPGSGDSEFTPPPQPTWGIKNPGTYRVRVIFADTAVVSDRYFDINIPNAPGGNNDFNIKYDVDSGVVSYVVNARGVTPSTLISHDWIEHNITVKNSFGGGNIIVDGDTVFNIGVNGKTFLWEESTFPHSLEAIDQIFADGSGSFMRIFQNWTKPGGFSNSNLSISINDVNDVTYTANFNSQFNITVQNQFSDGTGGGSITVDGFSQSSPYNFSIVDTQSISVTAVPNTTSGMDWTFDHWFDGNTSASRVFTPDSNRVYTAFFRGTPDNYNRNLHFSGRTGQKVTILWTISPNPNVSYEIWRKVKHNGVMGNPIKIAVLGHTDSSFVDQEYDYTSNYTNDLLLYDVRFYYAIDQTSSSPSYVTVFGKKGIIAPIANKGNGKEIIAQEVKKNSLDNYPNPFNPSTIIQYQIKEGGFVTVKVYDYIGKEVAVLVNKEQPSGSYSVRFDASRLASGVYLYTINAKGFHKVKKMILLR